MSDLRDERVREISTYFDPDYAEDQVCNGAGDGFGITEGEVTALAREVLALRERVAGAERVSRLDREELAASTARIVHLRQEAADLHTALAGNEITIATLTRQRDEAVAVAREAVEMIHPMHKSDKRDLAARLAALQEGA